MGKNLQHQQHESSLVMFRVLVTAASACVRVHFRGLDPRSWWPHLQIHLLPIFVAILATGNATLLM